VAFKLEVFDEDGDSVKRYHSSSIEISLFTASKEGEKGKQDKNGKVSKDPFSAPSFHSS
jgi:hypothetical protein